MSYLIGIYKHIRKRCFYNYFETVFKIIRHIFPKLANSLTCKPANLMTCRLADLLTCGLVYALLAIPAFAKHTPESEYRGFAAPPPGAPLSAKWEGERGVLSRWYASIQISESEFLARAGASLGLADGRSELYLSDSGGAGMTGLFTHRFKRYRQRYQGYRVKDGELALSLDRAGNVVSVFNHLYPIREFHSFPALSQSASRDIAVQNIDMSDLRAPETVETVIAVIEGIPHLVHQWRIPAREPYGDWEILVDANTGEVVSRRDLRVFYVTGRGQVFIPDPKTAIESDTLRDMNDANEAIPLACYSTVDLQELDDPIGGVYYLSGRFVDTSPTSNRAAETSPDFLYLRQDDRFEEANVYYHLDTFHRYIISIGFDSVINRPQQCDVNGTTEDNSWFSPLTGVITYGSGGVDDGEDADVIIHEYGHAIQYDIQGGLSGGHTGAMGEGFSDYIAGTYSLRLNLNFHPEWVFTWDGHNEFWSGRWLNRPYHYPQHAGGPVHDSGQLWSAGLIDVWYDVPDTEIWDAIVFQHHYYLGNGATMEDAANAILLADINLNNAQYRWIIIENFTARGFVDSSYLVPVIAHQPLRDTEDTTLASFPITARITSNTPLDTASILLFWGVDGVIDDSAQFTVAGEDSFTAVIPGPFNRQTVNYYINAADIYGGLGLNPPEAPAALHSFYVGPDTIAPEIVSLTQPGNTIFPNGYGKMEITARDNIGLAEVRFHFRQTGNTYRSYGMTPAGGDTFTADYSWRGLEPLESYYYYISAQDNSSRSNRTVSPEYSFLLEDSVVFDDFERGLSNWEIAGGWDLQTGQSFSPPSAVNDRAGAGAAAPREMIITLAHPWLTAGLSDLYLGYQSLHFFLPQNDTGFVEVSQGAGWIPLDTVTGVSGLWEPRAVHLGGFLNGDSLAVRFRTLADTSAPHHGPGWYIDDVTVSTLPQVALDKPSVTTSPERFTLERIAPNPGNGEFEIAFTLPEAGRVEAKVFNIRGCEVARLAEGSFPAGNNVINWQSRESSGIYFLEIAFGGEKIYRKIVLMK